MTAAESVAGISRMLLRIYSINVNREGDIHTVDDLSTSTNEHVT